MIQDSGERREFDTGAVRDIQEGKGRCDLLPLGEAAAFVKEPKGSINNVLYGIGCFVNRQDTELLYDVLRIFCAERGWSKCDCILEVSKHYEEGAKKYGEYNWQKGIPCHCYVDSAVRHYLKWYRGDDDEPHDRAFVWNILCLIWTMNNKKELNDLRREDE